MGPFYYSSVTGYHPDQVKNFTSISNILTLKILLLLLHLETLSCDIHFSIKTNWISENSFVNDSGTGKIGCKHLSALLHSGSRLQVSFKTIWLSVLPNNRYTNGYHCNSSASNYFKTSLQVLRQWASRSQHPYASSFKIHADLKYDSIMENCNKIWWQGEVQRERRNQYFIQLTVSRQNNSSVYFY